MKKRILGIFDKRPLIWGHYMLLAGVLLLMRYVGVKYLELDTKGNFYIFIYYFLVISISDQLIHHLLKVD